MKTVVFPSDEHCKEGAGAGTAWELYCMYYWVTPWFFKIQHFH